MKKADVVMYHYVRNIKDSRYPKIKGLEKSLFIKQLDYFKKNCNFVGINDIINAVYSDKPLPDNAVLLTFDDGYYDHYMNVFPLLAKYDAPGLFAVPAKIIKEHKVLDVNKIHYILACTSTENILNDLKILISDYYAAGMTDKSYYDYYSELAVGNRFDSKEVIFIKRVLQNGLGEDIRKEITDKLFHKYVADDEKVFASELYMNMDHIRLMKKNGMDFAVHGYEHYWFDKLPSVIYEKDIMSALDVFDGIINNKEWSFCYPYGASSPELISFCKANGCVAGFTVKAESADLTLNDPMLIPRKDTNDFLPFI